MNNATANTIVVNNELERIDTESVVAPTLSLIKRFFAEPTADREQYKDAMLKMFASDSVEATQKAASDYISQNITNIKKIFGVHVGMSGYELAYYKTKKEGIIFAAPDTDDLFEVYDPRTQQTLTMNAAMVGFLAAFETLVAGKFWEHFLGGVGLSSTKPLMTMLMQEFRLACSECAEILKSEDSDHINAITNFLDDYMA